MVVLKDRRKTSYVVKLGFPTFAIRGIEHHSGQGNRVHTERRSEPLIRDLTEEGQDAMGLARFTIVNLTPQGEGFLTYRFRALNSAEVESDGSATLREGAHVATLQRLDGIRRIPAEEGSGRLNDALNSPKEANYELQICLADIVALGKLDTQFSTRIVLELQTYPDGRTEDIREALELRINYRVRRRFGKRLLALDFGTSAVAAGFVAGEYRPIDLQRAYVSGGKAGHHRGDNPEQGTPFIPSVAMAGQKALEQGTGECIGLGDPDILDLPVTTAEIAVRPELAILALKSYVGSGAFNLRLPGSTRLRYRDGERVIESDTVPIWSLVQSAYGKIERDYLRPALGMGGRVGRISQLAITHPNTYTLVQQAELRRVAHQVFVDVHAEDLHLVSESDAAAFWYLTQLRNNRGPNAQSREVALVYDIGAGTLDLSLVEVLWPPRTTNPKLIRVLGRCGIGLAGNKLDELVARVVNRRLTELSEAHPSVHFTPFVNSTPQGWDHIDNRRALFVLKQGIQELKQTIGRGKRSLLRLWPDRVTSAVFSVKDASTIPGQPLQRNEGHWWLDISHDEVLDDVDVTDFVSFITGTLVREFIEASGLALSDVSHLFVTGRTSQWPGLRERIEELFEGQRIASPRLTPAGLKSAVVQGALRMFQFGSTTRIEDSNISGTYGLEYLDPMSGKATITPLFQGRRGDWDSVSVAMGPVTRTVLKPKGEGRIDCALAPWVRLVCSFAGRLDAPREGWRRHLVVYASEQKPLDNLFARCSADQRGCSFSAEVDERSSLIVELTAEESGDNAVFAGRSATAHSVYEPPWPVGKAVLPVEVYE